MRFDMTSSDSWIKPHFRLNGFLTRVEWCFGACCPSPTVVITTIATRN